MEAEKIESSQFTNYSILTTRPRHMDGMADMEISFTFSLVANVLTQPKLIACRVRSITSP